MADDVRAFKSAWFGKAARKAGIADDELRKAIAQVMAGQADDLGGGVYKKRLSNNQHRSIVLARGGKWWVFEFLYAKQNRANITADELKGFRKLAKTYSCMTDDDMTEMTATGDWIEIAIDRIERRR